MPEKPDTVITKRATRFSGADLVSVLLPLPLRGAYDYLVPQDMTVQVGDFVTVPLGPRHQSGVIWGPGTSDIDPKRIKPILNKHDTPPLTRITIAFIEWVAAYAMQPNGAVLKMVMSTPKALEPPPSRIGYVKAENPPEFRRTLPRLRVLQALKDTRPFVAADLARKAHVTPNVISALAKVGGLETALLSISAFPHQPNPDHLEPELSKDQIIAAKSLSEKVSKGFSVTLVDGVPGAGKTEVYFHAVAQALRNNKQVLVMLPEIALSAQWIDRFRRRFGHAPAEWHSDITVSQRRDTWRAVALKHARVIVGARSALFLPYQDLGLIVVDEEHESAFKQEDGVIYNARDMAVVRAQIGKLPIVLVSATPSLETVVNTRRGRYQILTLPNRHGGAELPEVKLVNMLKAPPDRGKWLSPALEMQVAQTISRGEQTLLFLNRRGYAPLTLCRTCGHRFQCPRCTSWLVEHRLVGRLQCHHCGFQLTTPEICPLCEDNDSLVPCGPGVERLFDEVKAAFPAARVLIATSDNIQSPKAAENLVYQIEQGEIDIIIGTQIVAKGYHFPMLTLVGAIDADLGLQGGDLRASERTYQLLYQVAGRAGREERKGRVVLQTYNPTHPVFAALCEGNRDAFLEAEIKDRETSGMPPFGRLAALIISGKDEQEVDRGAEAIGRAAPDTPEFRVLGPAPAPINLLRGRHRRRFLVIATRQTHVQPILRAWISRARWSKKIRIQIDIDPISFF